MNHARVKALKGNGKTTSRKAIKSGRASSGLTPNESPMASLLTSPAHSATPSRVASDNSDSDDDLEADFDDMSLSVHSGGSLGDIAEDGTPTIDAQALLDHIQDRKHNNSETREQYLEVFLRLLRTLYTAETHEWLDSIAPTLADLFLRDANRSATARERLLNLQAFCLLIGTAEDLDVFDTGYKLLKQVVADDDDDDCRINAMIAMCMTVLYGGGDEDAALELMEYFVEIIQTDGESIEAYDNGPVVNAALQGWAFTASHVSDFADFADPALDAFVDQLDSGDLEIQASAAFCIALIFESSRNHEEETGETFQLGYDPHRLAERIKELSKLSAKSVSRKSRKDLRENLVSVVTSLERGVGPFYSTALFVPEKDSHVPASQMNDNGQAEYGYRGKLRLGNASAKITSWSLLSRINMMRGLFRGGLQNHVFVNPVVMECLDDASFEHGASSEDHGGGKPSKGRKR
ncbi:hypothetical protein S40293_08072 [Stachybotrys chartarum IBT 40293]|nr:hypothetical protein S40293_08072 [Stachybotrys chartarum IBT 40293]